MSDATEHPLDSQTEAQAERGLENFVYASGIWARASGGTGWSYPGLDCFESTVARRAFNQAILATDASVTRDDLQDAIARFDKIGLRYRVRVREAGDNAVRARLEELGIVRRGGIPAMVFDGTLPEAPPNTLSIKEVTRPETLLDHVAVVAQAFEWEAEQLGEVFRPALLDEPSWFGWVGYDNGAPVAASQLVTHESTGGLYYVAVLDSHRRKGYGEAITRVAIRAAHSQECNLVTLNASTHGYPVYKRLGFRDAGMHIGYTPPDEDVNF